MSPDPNSPAPSPAPALSEIRKIRFRLEDPYAYLEYLEDMEESLPEAA